MNSFFTAPRYFRDESEKKVESLFETLVDSNINPTVNSMKNKPKEKPVYSGTYVKGLATMHKSNITVVGSGDNPVNYATMRRS